MRSLASFSPHGAFLLSAFLGTQTVVGQMNTEPTALAAGVESDVTAPIKPEASAYGSEPASQFAEAIRPMLVEFCGDCHDSLDDEDPVRFLRSRTADEVAQHRGIWEAAAEQLRNRTMPPGDEPQPSEAQRLRITQWIESHLDATACSQGDFAGAPVPRRLNRQQYTYAIQDLTGEAFDFIETIPADGSGGEGFTNNGETLFLPPLLMERYMEVAQQILDHIVVTEPFDVTYVPRKTDVAEVFEFVDETKASAETQDEMQPGFKVSAILPVYTDAECRFTLKAVAARQPSPIVLSIDGIEVKRLTIPTLADAPARWTRLHFSRGVHRIELRTPAEAQPITIQWLRLNQETGDKREWRRRQAATQRLLAPGRDLIGKDNRKAAEEIIRQFARIAWRRGVTDDELGQLMQLYDRGAGRDESIRQAIKLPLKAVLVSPKFLFVSEQGYDSPGIHRISDIELASRLSLFLWNSLPDDELLRLAETNRLHRADELHRQVRRMLADGRSYRFAESFAGQWLGTVAVGITVIPDTEFFRPVYTSELVTDLRRQVGETMHWMLRENRPLTDWLDCDYMIINRRLARHYGIQPIPKSFSKFEKVDVDDSPRAGVLGLGAVHMLTSYSRRTSPVLRGGWVLETIFGTRLPAPPPDAGALEGGEQEMGSQTVRQRLEKHRANPACAACHDLMDPIGFALENFDVLGRWRETEGENKINAHGKLPSGETFVGPVELRQVLVDRKEEFVREVSKRMLGFALGRSLQDADGCTISGLTTRLKQNEYKIQQLVVGIVESIPFQYRQGFQSE